MNKMVVNSTVFRTMEEWAPLHLAYDWDPVGIQVGSASRPVKKVMITLDVLESVVDEAIENKVDLIIAHHPLLFKPLQQIDVTTPKGKVLEKLIKHDITVYAAHTNLDIAADGVNDMLCDQLGITKRKNLIDFYSEKLFKIAVYVPDSHAEVVRNALSEAGAGHIGNYSHCTFQTNGQGTFKPLEGTTPYIGSQNKLEFVEEIKIETIINEKKLAEVIDVMIAAHPYEEVAYDVFPLENKGTSYGLGRIGSLHQKMNVENLARHVKKNFDLSHVRVIGNLKKDIQKIAVLGGSGEKYIHQAKKAGADVYITGDMSFHVAQDAEQMGLTVIDAGHYIEKVMKNVTKNYLQEQFKHSELEVIVSKTNTDPFQFI